MIHFFSEQLFKIRLKVGLLLLPMKRTAEDLALTATYVYELSKSMFDAGYQRGFKDALDTKKEIKKYAKKTKTAVFK